MNVMLYLPWTCFAISSLAGLCFVSEPILASTFKMPIHFSKWSRVLFEVLFIIIESVTHSSAENVLLSRRPWRIISRLSNTDINRWRRPTSLPSSGWDISKSTSWPVSLPLKIKKNIKNNSLPYTYNRFTALWILSGTTRVSWYHYATISTMIKREILLLSPTKKEVMFLVRSVCLSVRRITRKLVNGFWWIFWRGRAWLSRTKWYNFGGDLDHASDPGVQSPKSGSSGSVEVCALW